MTLQFEPFQVYKDGDNLDGVVISFDFYVHGAASKSYSFDRTYVNELLGKDTGKIETVDEMVTLLQSLMGGDWPDVIIEASSPSQVTVKLSEAADRRAGSDSYLWFHNIQVSIEPIPQINFLDIDIVENPDKLDFYIDYIDVAAERIIDGASVLGALEKRIEMQSDFTRELMDSIDRGVGRLVDADMKEESTRLKALQTQEQLAIQALQIANSNAESVMQLFR